MRPIPASLFVIASLTAAAAHAQSFNCGLARYADELVICRDPYLAKLDEQLAHAFAAMFGKLSPEERKDLAADEEDWVVSRRRCGADAHCIAEEYRNRIGELTGVAPPGRPNPPAAAATKRSPQQAPRQTVLEPVQGQPQPPEVFNRPPPGPFPRPPFPVIEGPPQPRFPGVERAAPPSVVEQAPPPALERPARPYAAQHEPPARVVEQPASPPSEQRSQTQTEHRSQTTVGREPASLEKQQQPSAEARDQPNPERLQQQVNVETHAQTTLERKQSATSGSGSAASRKGDRRERKSASHEAHQTAESNPSPDLATPEREVESKKPAPRRTHKATPKQEAAVSAPAAAPNPPRTASTASALSAGSPAKPSIQWVDPPPSR